MRSYIGCIIAGFAMFAMFFGSGNLVFPLLIGKESVDNFEYATAGLLITGVLVPFIGVFSMILYNGDYKKYFGHIGNMPSFLLVMLILCLLGPFGVVPRCILVSYSGFTLLGSIVPIEVYSAVFSILAIIVMWKHQKIVDIIGKFLTPILITGLVTVIFFGIVGDKDSLGVTQPPLASFKHGLTVGYLTMDLLAAFFFGITTIKYLNKHYGYNRAVLLKASMLSSFIGAILLFAVYIGFVYLGAKYSYMLSSVSKESLLITIASYTLGSYAKPIVGLTIIIACFTTAVILAMLFAQFLSKDVIKEKISSHKVIILTMVISYFMSLLGFEKIMIALASILKVIYPALIVFAIANIVEFFTNRKVSGWGFWLALLVSIIIAVLDII